MLGCAPARARAAGGTLSSDTTANAYQAAVGPSGAGGQNDRINATIVSALDGAADLQGAPGGTTTHGFMRQPGQTGQQRQYPFEGSAQLEKRDRFAELTVERVHHPQRIRGETITNRARRARDTRQVEAHAAGAAQIADGGEEVALDRRWPFVGPVRRRNIRCSSGRRAQHEGQRAQESAERRIVGGFRIGAAGDFAHQARRSFGTHRIAAHPEEIVGDAPGESFVSALR